MGRQRRSPREKIGDGEFPFSPSSVPRYSLISPRHSHISPRHSLISPPSFAYLTPVIPLSLPRHSRESGNPYEACPRENGDGGQRYRHPAP